MFALLCRGYYELAPFLDFVNLYQPHSLDDLPEPSEGDFQPNETALTDWFNAQMVYRQSNASLGPEIYATLRTGDAYLPVSHTDIIDIIY